MATSSETAFILKKRLVPWDVQAYSYLKSHMPLGAIVDGFVTHVHNVRELRFFIIVNDVATAVHFTALKRSTSAPNAFKAPNLAKEGIVFGLGIGNLAVVRGVVPQTLSRVGKRLVYLVDIGRTIEYDSKTMTKFHLPESLRKAPGLVYCCQLEGINNDVTIVPDLMRTCLEGLQYRCVRLRIDGHFDYGLRVQIVDTSIELLQKWAATLGKEKHDFGFALKYVTVRDHADEKELVNNGNNKPTKQHLDTIDELESLESSDENNKISPRGAIFSVTEKAGAAVFDAEDSPRSEDNSSDSESLGLADLFSTNESDSLCPTFTVGKHDEMVATYLREFLLRIESEHHLCNTNKVESKVPPKCLTFRKFALTGSVSNQTLEEYARMSQLWAITNYANKPDEVQKINLYSPRFSIPRAVRGNPHCYPSRPSLLDASIPRLRPLLGGKITTSSDAIPYNSDSTSAYAIVDSRHMTFKQLKDYFRNGMLTITPTYIGEIERFFAVVHHARHDFLENVWTDDEITPSIYYTEEYAPKVFHVILARHNYDKKWYRAKVLEVKDQMVHVFFVDYGATAYVPILYCASLPRQIAELPFQAVLFRIHDLTDITKNKQEQKYGINILRKGMLNRKINVRIAKYNNEEITIVFNEPSFDSLSNVLLQKGVAKRESQRRR